MVYVYFKDHIYDSFMFGPQVFSLSFRLGMYQTNIITLKLTILAGPGKDSANDTSGVFVKYKICESMTQNGGNTLQVPSKPSRLQKRFVIYAACCEAFFVLNLFTSNCKISCPQNWLVTLILKITYQQWTHVLLIKGGATSCEVYHCGN